MDDFDNVVFDDCDLPLVKVAADIDDELEEDES